MNKKDSLEKLANWYFFNGSFGDKKGKGTVNLGSLCPEQSSASVD